MLSTPAASHVVAHRSMLAAAGLFSAACLSFALCFFSHSAKLLNSGKVKASPSFFLQAPSRSKAMSKATQLEMRCCRSQGRGGVLVDGIQLVLSGKLAGVLNLQLLGQAHG